MELGAIQQLTQNPSIIVNRNDSSNEEILNLLRQIDKKLILLLRLLLPDENQLDVLAERGSLSEELKAKSLSG